MKLILALLFSLVATVASAQQATAQWDHQLATGQVLADFQSPNTVVTFKVDAAAPVTLTQTCAALTAGSIRCTAPVTVSNGPHTLTLTATNSFGSAATSITGAPPSLPTGFKIVIIITTP